MALHHRDPDGTERLYVDGVFNTDPDYCETFGHDLATGAAFSEAEYRAKNPAGRAFLHSARYEPSPEVPDDEYPLLLTTGGRTVYHFHTRTKTGRVRSSTPPLRTSGSRSLPTMPPRRRGSARATSSRPPLGRGRASGPAARQRYPSWCRVRAFP